MIKSRRCERRRCERNPHLGDVHAPQSGHSFWQWQALCAAVAKGPQLAEAPRVDVPVVSQRRDVHAACGHLQQTANSQHKTSPLL